MGGLAGRAARGTRTCPPAGGTQPRSGYGPKVETSTSGDKISVRGPRLGASLRKSRVGVSLSLPTAASQRTEEVILGICRSVLGLQGTRPFPRLRS